MFGRKKHNHVSDAELNELSAIKVMGWEVYHNEISKAFYYTGDPISKNDFHHKRGIRSWNPTTDMNDAMELINALCAGYHHIEMMTNEKMWMARTNASDWIYSDTLPRAITIASILAKE